MIADQAQHAVLETRQLGVRFAGGGRYVHAVDNVDLVIPAGKTIALVGNSGCGKTTTALAIMGMLPKTAVRSGSALLYGDESPANLLELCENEMRHIRGKDIAMVFQQPTTALNPVRNVGGQVAEVLLAHQKLSRREAKERAIRLFSQVGIPGPARCFRTYPHELSGGMQQRVMIAAALACKPKLLIADEPTSSLDVTVQAQVLELFRKLGEETGVSMLFITHDFGVVAQVADYVCVMSEGKIVEKASVADMFARPQHACSRQLLDSARKIRGDQKERD